MLTAAVQLAGVALVTVGLVFLFGPWALVGCGAALLVVPEIAQEVSRRRDAAAKPDGPGDPRQS